jgi:hypothetical protein
MNHNHLEHKFKEINNTTSWCVACDLRRENYYNVLTYKRNGVDYSSMEPKCINMEYLNKDVFESLEF